MKSLPLPSSYCLIEVAEEPFPLNFASIANLGKSASPHAHQNSA